MAFYAGGGLGPPDPISYLRNISREKSIDGTNLDYNVLRKLDSEDHHRDDGLRHQGEDADPMGDDSVRSRVEGVIDSADAALRRNSEDPPARERPRDGEPWPARENLSFTRSLIFYGAGAVTEEHEEACRYIQEAQGLRQKYFGGMSTVVNNEELLKEQCLFFVFGKDGVVELLHSSDPKNLVEVPTVEDFYKDYRRITDIVNEGAMRSYCFQRLQLLSTAFKMHATMNGPVEMQEQSALLGMDFYRTMKIDNHIHAAAAPSAKQFVQFVGKKLKDEPNEVVFYDGRTLEQVFQEAGIDACHMTIDAFNVLADYSVYQRFDNFNTKYSPFRMADMRRIFLKTTNHNEGRYFAELMKLVLNRHETSQGHNSACEMRLSIYGMERHEWLDLAKWMLTDWKGDYPGPVISTHNRWLVQVPRLWRIFSSKPDGKDHRSFLEMLENVFVPIFQATLYPEHHPEVAELLKHIVGFDSVDDEGFLEDTCTCQRPHEWKTEKNPAYWWQLYYLWANLEVLNRLRRARGLNTFAFRPHAGETGDPLHLAVTYMLCQSINHGINLDMQIADNPFPKLFRRGLNVTLSTDDPLLFHMSDDALLEEYSVARATFDLSMTDISEIARNSVLQSGFEEDFKREWLGDDYQKGVTFCDERKTHVPLIRAKFRAEHLAIEHMLCQLIGAGKGAAVLREMKVQFGLARDAHRSVLFENFAEVPSFPEQNQL